jgi:hypothetical protein
MGYLEGLLSHDRIYDAYYNIIHSSNPVPAHVLLFASQQVQPPLRFSSAALCSNSRGPLTHPHRCAVVVDEGPGEEQPDLGILATRWNLSCPGTGSIRMLASPSTG